MSAVGIIATVVLVVFVAIGLGIIAYAVGERRWLRDFPGRAVSADAVVDRVKATSSAVDSMPGPELRYQAVVSFRLPDGSLQQATTRWPTGERPVVGGVLPVRYDPQRPRRVVPATGPGSKAPPIAGYVAIGVASMVMGYVFSSILRVFA